MSDEMMVFAILITVAVLVAAIQFVITMIQIRKTAKEVEAVAIKLNQASPLLDVISAGASVFSTITNKIKGLFGK